MNFFQVWLESREMNVRASRSNGCTEVPFPPPLCSSLGNNFSGFVLICKSEIIMNY